MGELRALHRGVGDAIRRWTLRVCPECGGAKVDDDRYVVCEGPQMGPFPTERSHRPTPTDVVEVVEAEWVLWARDTAQQSADKWRREYDELYERTRRSASPRKDRD